LRFLEKQILSTLLRIIGKTTVTKERSLQFFMTVTIKKITNPQNKNAYKGGLMANLIILDDNRKLASSLKLMLIAQGHRLLRISEMQELFEKIYGFKPDLILINRYFEGEYGWDAFNLLKMLLPGTPALLYVLKHANSRDIENIVKAIDNSLYDNKVFRQSNTRCLTKVQRWFRPVFPSLVMKL
jgi:hypothetical protein